MMSIKEKTMQIQVQYPKHITQNKKISAYAGTQNPFHKLDQVKHSNVHILDRCATLENLSQTGQPNTVFSNQSSFYK